MRFIGLGLAIALVAGSAGAQTAQQFDLTCSGTRVSEVDGPAEPYEYGFRIDLGTSRWCWDHCEVTYPIAEVGPDRIVLNEKSVDDYRERSSTRNEVSRVTGVHTLSSISVRPLPRLYKVEGRCVPGPFTGFPAALF